AQGLAARVWADATAAYDDAADVGARARLESTVGLLRSLAVTGGPGLLSAREHRVAAIAAADELGDVELTARVIGAYDVPAIWTRVDDEGQARRVVGAAEHALAGLPADADPALRARLLATVAVETRGSRSARGPQAARLAERIARDLDDPALLAFALNGTWMQLFTRTGLATERARVGHELVTTARRAGLLTYEALGHMVGMQSASALGDVVTADAHAARLDDLSATHELPLIGVFTTWYRAMRLDAGDAPLGEAEAAYRAADARLEGAGMPGMHDGLLALALLCARVRRGVPAPDDGLDTGPFTPWVAPWHLLARGRRADAREALLRAPDPPPGLLLEALWALMARAAVGLDVPDVAARAAAALRPAEGEVAGAGSAVLTLGPVAPLLADLGT
ncbi:SARP family transcriptional regulator, partial [Cellulomonas sp. APG4]|nr:SARP family transcriptional regulator [Cellulomonas sp. APG4]